MTPHAPRTPKEGVPLSPQEERVLALSASGLTDPAIAERMGVAIHTVRTYWQRIRAKVGGGTRAEIVTRNAQLQNAELTAEIAEHRETDRRLRSVLDAMPQIVWVTDAHKQIRYANRRCREYMGDEAFASIQEWTNFVHPDDLEATTETVRIQYDADAPFECRARFRRHDGEYRWHLVRGERHFDEDGYFAGYVGTLTDIHLAALSEERLRESEERYRSAIEGTIDLFLILQAVRDESGVIVDFAYVDVNGATERYTGLAKETMIGRRMSELFGYQTIADYIDLFRHVVETGEVLLHEAPAHLPSHAGIWFHMRAARVGDGVAVKFRDVTERRHYQEQLETQNHRLRELSAVHAEAAARASSEHAFVEAVLSTIGSLVCVLDREGRIVRFNAACEELTGWTESEIVGRQLWDTLCPPEECDELKAMFARLRGGSFPSEHENYWVTRAGERRLIEFRNTALTKPDGEVKFFIGTGIDVTQVRAAAEATRRMREQLELAQRLASIGSWEQDAGSDLPQWSAQMLELFGFDPAGPTPAWSEAMDRVLPEDRPAVLGAIERCLATGEEVVFRHRVQLPSGEVRTVETMSRRLEDGNRIVGTTMDVTVRERWEVEIEEAMMRTVEESVQLEIQRQELTALNEKLTRLATTDGLTGVANHRTFQEHLEEDVQHCRRTGNPLSLVLLDVDHFKRFNDDFGHQAGDVVLKAVAATLDEACRAGDTVARYGGEEFAVILRDADPVAAIAAAERLREAIANRAWPHRPVTLSLGISTFTPGLTREDLIGAADRALYASKTRGRNRSTHIDSVGANAGIAIVSVCESPPSSSSPDYRSSA
jgi:diguanylate cyclase (GGDEF)-like protein/PAS domain S-box-containing protein